MNGVWEAVRGFFETGALNPHGICLLWRPALLWTHAGSDSLIGLAYFSIPLALGAFVYRRPDVRFGWLVWMFVAFILLCGVTHFMAVWTLWHADYGIEALFKVATAAVSLATAVAIWPLLPKALALPSTKMLQASLAERDRALVELRTAMDTMVEMREHEARQKLLLDELNHRVKNTLASVQSVATQTLRDSDRMEEARDLFIDRLIALSSTHNLLVQHQWESATLRELTEATLQPYGRPYTYTGPDLRLDPNLAVSLGMALHELTTNALKHGAWLGAGRVDIEVTRQGGDHVWIVWRETGGPLVRTPRGRGFGSRLLEHGVAGELGGEVTIEFAKTGIICTIRAPLSDRIRLAAAA